MDEDLKLYIPLGVKPEAELFTGFGKKQLFQSIVGSLVMGGIAALAWLFTGNVTTTVILALAGIFGSVMMTTKDQSNLSVVDQVQNLIRFLRGQKIYPYRYGDEWGLESCTQPFRSTTPRWRKPPERMKRLSGVTATTSICPAATSFRIRP